MLLDLRLDQPSLPRIADLSLGRATGTLQKITAVNHAKAVQGAESRQLRNDKEKMKQRLIQAHRTGESFEQATRGSGRERILLSLYLEYAARSDAEWLPSFAEKIVDSLLGLDGGRWHSGRRRQATQLFFTHFDRLIPALETLCRRLLESYQSPGFRPALLTETWQRHRATIFTVDGPQQVAAQAKQGEELPQLVERFAVPTTPADNRFLACLKDCFLLNGLNQVKLGQGQEILAQLEALRTSPYEAGVLLGAAALRIMTQRVLASGGEWKGDWPDWILRLGCDPSLPPASALFGQWWGCWHPTQAELECARRAVNRQTLEYFIQFLEISLRGNTGYDQFEARAGFLRWLDDTRKIIRFKLLLHPQAFGALPRAYREQRHRVAKIEGAAQGTSVIVMECADGIWIVEGTHSFAVRVFHHQFPLPEVFSKNRSSYPYADFTQGAMHRYTCMGIWKAHMGNWLPDLLWQMQSNYHVEWSLTYP